MASFLIPIEVKPTWVNNRSGSTHVSKCLDHFLLHSQNLLNVVGFVLGSTKSVVLTTFQSCWNLKTILKSLMRLSNSTQLGFLKRNLELWLRMDGNISILA